MIIVFHPVPKRMTRMIWIFLSNQITQQEQCSLIPNSYELTLISESNTVGTLLINQHPGPELSVLSA